MSSDRKRLAVLISGRGSNMESIMRASEAPDYPAAVVLVIADNAEAKGLQTASANDIKSLAIERSNFPDKASHEAEIISTLSEHNIDLVCLAGYMRLLSADFTSRFEGRLINIHPSLLPKFKGLDTHQRALDAGETEHGCTVHFVNAEMDGGAIIRQASVPVLESDTAETLAARVLIEEHKLYPAVIRDFWAG